MRYSSKPAKNSGVRSNQWSTAMKVTAVLSAFVAVGVGAGSIIAALTKTAERNIVDLSYGSVSTPIEEGEVFANSGGYNAVDVFARLNWRFAQQTEWYGEYSGYVNTVVTQDVHTYKYYKDGMLISADITESSLVNAAREFCYVKERDRVLWREAAGGSSTYDKLDTPWQEGEPYRNMTISGENGFKAVNGLPAFELSPYVIEPDTVLSSKIEVASEEEYAQFYPKENRAPQRDVKRAQGQEGEGGKLYKASFQMNPDIWTDTDENGNEIVKGANAYYINQMIFTGGLPEAPEFTSLNITYYFDENWVTYATVVEEDYSAAYGPIKAPCKGGGTTTYSYEPYNKTDNPYPDAYEEYFQYYMDAEPDTDFDRPITALDALAGAFGPLLAEPSTLQLDLEIGKAKQAGTVFVDLSKTDLSAFDVNAIEARLSLGALKLYIEGGKAYINYGGASLSLSLSELLSLFSPAQPTAEGEEESSGGINTDDLLGALANGEFIAEDGKAELHSVLPLLGLEIPIDFYFNVDEEKNVTLDHAAVAIEGETLSLGADISFGGEPIPALKAEEKANYVELIPHIQSLIDLFKAEELHADLGYQGHGVEVTGGIDVAISPFALKGEVNVRIPAYGGEKTLALAYTDGKAYLDLGGIKVAADVKQAVEIVKEYLDLSSLQEGALPFDLGEIVQKLLSDEFAQNISSSEKESKLSLLLRGTKILEAFGVDFALGDVSLEIAPDALSAYALGASVTLKKGDAFTVAPEGYTDILPYAARIAELISGGYLAAGISYTGETLSVTGNIDFDIQKLAVKGELTLHYMESAKSLEVLYADGELYLTVDGLRIKANVQEAIEIVKEFVEIGSEDRDALRIVSDILSLDFAELVKLSEGEEGLTVTVATTALLQKLGLGFDLGDAILTVGEEEISLSVYGANVTIKAGKAFDYSLEGYSEIAPYANTLVQIYQSGYLALDLRYEIGSLELYGKVDLDLTSFEAAATLTLSSGEKSKAAEILYAGGGIFLGIDNIRVKVNAEEGAELLGGLLDLDASGEEIDLLKTLLNANFATLVPELWEADGTLHITLSSGNLLSLFGIDFDLGDLRFAVDGKGATLKLGRAVLTAKAGAAFTPVTEGYLDITDYLGAVTKFAGAEAIVLDVDYTGKNIVLDGAVSVMVDGSAAKGDLTLTYKNKENEETKHAIALLWTKEEDVVYLALDGIKVKADVDDALALIKSLLPQKEKGAENADSGISTVALTDAELTDEELTALEKLLSFDLAEFFSLTETKTEGVGTLSLTVRGTQLLSALGASFDLGDIVLSLDTEADIALTALEGKLILTVRAGDSFEADGTDGYIDIVKYGEYLLKLFEKRTYKISAVYKGSDLQVRADVSFDTVSKIVKGDLILIYKNAAKEASFTYENEMFYLDLGGTYRFKTKTTGAVALLAGYLGLSGTEKVTFTDLADVLDCNLDGLLALHEQPEGEEILTVLINGSALLKALGINFDLGEVDLQIAEDYLYAKVKGFGAEVTGSGAELEGLEEEDKAGYTDLSQYLDGFTNVFKQNYLTLGIAYNKDGVKVDGNIYIDLKNEKGVQARADVKVTVNGTAFRIGIVYANDGTIYLNLDGAKIQAKADKILSLVQGLFQKDKSGEAEKISAYTLIADAPVADMPATVALSEEQKSKLLGVLEKLLSLNLDDYFALAEEDDALTLTVQGTELLAKLFDKDIALGNVGLKVEKSTYDEEGKLQKNGGITLTVLGATLTATGSNTAFALFDEGDGSEHYADIIEYVGYLTDLFKAEALHLEIDTLTIHAGETTISAEGNIDIKTDGSLAGGTLNLKVGGKSLTLTLYYEKTDGTFYLELGGVKLKASIEDIRDLIDKLKNKEPAAAHALRLAAIFAENDLFGANVEDGVFSLALNGKKLVKLLGLDISLDEITLKVAQGSLGVSASSDKFGLDATLSKANSIEFDTPENKASYIDLVKYVDYAVDLFRHKAYDLTISYAKNDLTIEGTVSFDTESKTAKAALNLGYKSAKKHLDLIYKDGYLYLTLAKGNKEEFKFKANTASAVALILGYLGVSGTDELHKLDNMPDDVFADLFKDFEKLISLSESEEINEENNEVNYVLTLLVNGTELLEKLKISLGNFDLGNIGVQLKKDSLALTVLGANLTLTGIEKVTLGEFKEADYVDLSAYVDSVVNIFKQNVITLAVDYDDNGVAVEGSIRIDVQNKQARADITIKKGETKISLGIVYDSEGCIYLDLDGAKIKAKAQDIIDRIKGLFSKNDNSEQDSGEPLGRRLSARTPLKAALTEDQKSKLLGILETILSLNLDDYFELSESKAGEEGADSLTLTVKGTELLAKLLKKDIKLGNVDLKVENGGALTLTVLGATITATGSNEGFVLFDEGDSAEKYADILQYIDYISKLFKSDILKLHIENLTVQAGDTTISAEGDIDIRTDGSLAGGTLTLKVGGKSLTLTLYYEKTEEENAEKRTLYLELGGVKLKASIEDIKTLIDKLKNKEPAAANALRLAATIVDNNLFGVGVDVENNILDLVINSGKLTKLLGLDIALDNIALTVKEGSLGVSASSDKFGLDATLSEGADDSFKDIADENKKDYVDLVKYVDYAVDLFRKDAFEIGLGFTKGEFTITGSASFAPKSKVASGEFTITYGTTSKHAVFAYQDGTAYIALDGSNGVMKFKAKSAASVALLAAYFGFSGTDKTLTNTFTDAFQGVFTSFDSLFALSENAEKDVLTLMIDGTQLLEKLKISLGSFELGDIGVKLGKDSLTLSVLGLQVTLGGTDTAPVLPTEEELAAYTDLSDYADTLAALASSEYLGISISYTSNDEAPLSVKGDVYIAVKEKNIRANVTIEKGDSSIVLGVVYTGGKLYIDLDGAKIALDAKEAVSYLEELIKGAKGRARSVRNAPMAILNEEQTDKLLSVLKDLFTLELDNFFTVEEGEGGISILLNGTGLLQKLLKKEIALGDVKLTVGKSVFGADGTVEKCGNATLEALGATIVLGRSAQFTAFSEGDGAENYTDVLQYVKWAADIFAEQAKTIELSVASGDLTVGLKLNVVKGNAFMEGVITLTYQEKHKDFNFVYENAEGMIYLDLDGIKIKAKTEDILDLFKSLFKNVSGEEADTARTRALGYAAAAILNADGMAFGAFSLTEDENVLTLTVSGEKLMGLLGDKVQSLLGGKFSLEDVGLIISQSIFKVEAEAALSGSPVSLSVAISKGEKTELGEEKKAELASYIDVFKYGRMVKKLFTESAALQADIQATIGGKEFTLTFMFKKDFTMAQGTLRLGSLDLDIIYVLKDRKVAEGEKDVVLYVKAGENVKLMANVSEVIRLIKQAKDSGEAKGRARSAAPIALTPKQETMLEKFLDLNLGEVIALKKSAEGGDCLEIAIESQKLLDLLGVNFDLGKIGINISEGELKIAVGEKVKIDLYGTTRSPDLEELAEGAYHDITPIVARVVKLIEAQAIEFTGELAFGETTLTINEGIFSWKTNEEKKFYLDASLGSVNVKLRIEGQSAQLQVGSFGVEFDFSDIEDLINAVKKLVKDVKDTIAEIKKNITGEFSREDLVSSLSGLVEVLNNLIKFLGGSKDAASAAASAKEVLDMGGMQVLPAAYAPEEGKISSLFSFTLGKLAIDILDETKDSAGLLGLKLTVGDAASPTLTARVDTAVFTGDFPELAGDFYKLSKFIEMLGYAGDAVALVSEPNLSAQINGNVLSSNVSTYTTAAEGADGQGLVYSITGNMDYASGGSFPIHLDMDDNVITLNVGFFLHFKLFLKAGTQESIVNGKPVDTTPKNLYLDIFITDCNLKDEGKDDGELDFFVTVSQVGDPDQLKEGNTDYNPLKLYAPAKEILTILSGAASILGLDGVTYVNQYLIAPLLEPDMVARLKGLGVSLVPTILDLLLKDTKEEEQPSKIANELLDANGGFSVDFGDVTLRFDRTTEGDETFLTLFGITTKADEKSGSETFTKTTDLTFGFKRAGTNENEKKPADLTGFSDIEGVDELLLALARTATHKATEEEVDQHIAAEGEYVRNDLFYVDGLLHLDLAIDFGLLGDIKLETINIKVDGLTVNFDANNQISLNAKLSYDGVYNVLAGTIIKGDTILDLTIADGMLYMRREQTSDFGGRNHDWRPLGNESIVIYRAMPLANFAKDNTTMMNNICFMFNLSEELISRIMGMVGTGGGGTATAPSDLGGLFKKYIVDATYQENGETNGLKNLLYTLTLNGAGLTNIDSFGNIAVKLGVVKGVLRSIEIPTFSIASVVNINANLGLRNPEYVWDDGYSDLTEDIAEQLKRGMDAKLQKVDWNATTYLEGQFTTVTYKLQDQVLGTQEVVFEPNTKELYATLSYPDIESFLKKNPSFRQDGYTYEWVKPNPNDFKAGMTISAQAQANTYELVFIIEKVDAEKYQVTTAELEAAGYSWDEAKGAYTKVFHWTYDPENYIDLPYITTKVGKIIGFRCPNGNLHNEDHRGLDFYDQPTVEYKAEWEYIDYTVTFDFGNGQTAVKETRHYGDAVDYPADPERTGYTFAGWDIPAVDGKHTVTGDETIKAQYTPNEYQVTLESVYPIEWDGFEFAEKDGKYVATLTFTYDSEVDLPKNIEYHSVTEGTVILTGFKWNGVLYSEYLPNVTDKATFTAVWEERGFKIEFVDGSGNVVATRYKHAGETLTQDELPDLAKLQRKGYTAQWDINIDTFIANDDCKISVKYTGIHYYITEYSLYAIAGYTEVKGEFDSEGVQGSSYWKKTYEYVFGGEPHPLTLGDSKSVKGYDFMGYFTERFGQGWPITSKQIDDDMIRDIFDFNVGNGSTLDEQNVLYVYWEDNSVEVHLYSDVDFADRTGHDVDGYYKSFMKMEGDYDISGETITPNEKEIQQIGWWYNDPEKGWRMVTDVGVFRNHDNKKQATVKLFALWVTDIKVSITTIQRKTSTFDIGGVALGGEVYPGGKSAEIYEKTGMTNPMTGVYTIWGTRRNGEIAKDELEYGREIQIDRDEGGTFNKNSMTSFNALLQGWKQIYGGVVATVRFTDRNGNVVATTSWSGIVSEDFYDVNVYDENGGVIGTEKVRIDCPYDEDDNGVLVYDILNGNSALGYKGYSLPTKEGYDYYWTIDGARISAGATIKGATEIRPNRTAQRFSVRFTSETALEDGRAWEKYGDGYATVCDLPFDSVIRFEGTSVTYTVALGENEFALPAVPERTGYSGKWTLSSSTQDSYGVLTVTVAPVYEANLYDVTFKSTQELVPLNGKWKSEGIEGDLHVYTIEMYYDSEIHFLNAENKDFRDCVKVGLNSVVDLSEIEIPTIGVRKGKWAAPDITANGATFGVDYGVDHVIYKSEVPFTYEGITLGETIDINADYALITPTVAGYTFLGWFVNTNGTWQQVTEIKLAETETTTTVEALWLSDMTVSFQSAEKSGLISKKYSAKVAVTGGELIGAAKESNLISVNMTFTYFANDDGNKDGTGHGVKSNQHDERVNTDELTNQSGWGNRSVLCCKVSIQYLWNGELMGKEITSFASKNV